MGIEKNMQDEAAKHAGRGGSDAKKFHADPDAPHLSVKDAARMVREERERRLGGESEVGSLVPEIEDLDDNSPPTAGVEGVPDWANVPAKMVFPDAWQVWFVRFPAEATNTRKKGERQCILWALSESDEKRAAKRANGDGTRIIDEMAKAMIRSVDGHVVDPINSSGPGSLAQFWNEIGGKCRHQLKSLYLKTHTMDAAENADFFERCVAVRTVG